MLPCVGRARWAAEISEGEFGAGGGPSLAAAAAAWRPPGTIPASTETSLDSCLVIIAVVPHEPVTLLHELNIADTLCRILKNHRKVMLPTGAAFRWFQ
ncbi:CXXC-type zinc finger protein 5 isoform X5 [Rhinatrema bivittatum]|uniref:CXXC-type zinc finger protein 5 isoform X5 n=1 Tax=Rhinatrema bivittatum TaxID=194408 RepID=UPI001128E567|nr:CXXC-type zinc finger protein 5 isoform X5 [Rhinatrema bivittatum]